MISQLIGGRYQIIKTLGSGGFCQTYIAEDTQKFNARCVVKKLKPVSKQPEALSVATHLFEREAQTQYRLGNHNQIPQLLAYFQENKEFYLVQELIEGHSLSEELPPGKQLSESEVIALLQNILEPLTFVHQQQVIHRDIKPPNLIRRHRDNKIVLIDFGAVKELAATEVLNPQGETKVITTIGTPGYMPSEQSTGKARFSSDIYAIGIIGIQALTGKMAQDLPEDTETAEIIWRDQITVSPKLAKVLDKMVRYDFRQRYRSAIEALEALQKLTTKKSSKSSKSSPLKLAIPSKKLITQTLKPHVKFLSTARETIPWLAGIAIAGMIVGLGGWYVYRQVPIQMTIKTIKESKQKGNYAKCISLSQAFSKNSAISTQLQAFRQDCQNLQAQGYLTKARQLAAEKKYEQGLVVLKQIAPDTSSYSQAQALSLQWNPANHEFYSNYQRALDYIAQSDYQQALEQLYLSADKAIIAGQSDLLLAEILKHEQGMFQPVTQEADQWQFLKDTLIKADPYDYELNYQRAKLKLDGDHNHHHTREFDLLFTAARQAIDNQQSERMLSQLKQDQQDRFKNFTIGHSEWINLLKALEQNNKQFLEN